MKTRTRRTLLGFAVALVASTLTINAVTRYYAFRSESSDFAKKHIFAFELITGLGFSELGPGDSVSVRPMIRSNSTEEMYVFIDVRMPFHGGLPLYDFAVDEDWTLVESTEGSLVYAYANSGMETLFPGDETSILTNRLTMKSIPVYEYAYIEDVNVTFYAYGIGVEDVPANPESAWEIAKELFGL